MHKMHKESHEEEMKDVRIVGSGTTYDADSTSASVKRGDIEITFPPNPQQRISKNNYS